MRDVRSGACRRGLNRPGKHLGVDWYARWGSPVYAAHDGTAKRDCLDRRTRRYQVRVGAIIGDRWVQTVYHHLDECLVESGEAVRRGDVVGTVGNTGDVLGDRPHLRFEVRVGAIAVDPVPWIHDGRMHHPMRPLP